MINKKVKSGSYNESDAKPENQTQRPIRDARIGQFKDRLALVIGNRSARGFSNDCGVSEGTMRSYLRGDTYPDLPILNNIAKVGDVLIEWLATGEGPMRRGYVAKPAAESFSVQEPAPGYEYLPLYDVQAAAGHGSLVEREDISDFLAFKSAWIRRELGADPKDLYLISVEGDSMEPALRPGDVILVDRRQAQAVPKDGIYVLQMEGSLLVKRLQNMPGGKIRVTSDNPSYSPFDLDKRWVDEHQVESGTSGIIGRVVWAGRRM